MYSAGAATWPVTGRGRWDIPLASACNWLPVIVLAAITYRQWVATNRYLHFRHALATVLSVQVILLLAAWKIVFVWNGF
jgi:hypothetical protein